MNEDKRNGRFVQLLIRWVFVVMPAAAIGYITLSFLNFSYTAFTSSILYQAAFFGAGLLIAYSLYFFRARWIFTVIILWLLYYVIGKMIVTLPGEFDVFYATAKFQLYAALFLFGWLFGFLLVRSKYSFILLVAVLAVATIVSVSNTIDVSLTYVLLHLVPVIVYGLYMLFLSPLLTEAIEMDIKKSARLLLRFSVFLILVVLSFIFVQRLLKSDLTAVEKELAARGAKDKKDKGSEKDQGYDQRNGLMDKPGGDDGYRLKDTMKINSKMSQSDVLMFCAKLDNFYPDGAPKPLYFVYHYLTRYDPARETFTRDVNVPSFDEFDADPSLLEMYHAKEDPGVIERSLGRKFKKVVEARVYLSSNTWKHSLLSPANAFYVQAIPVEKDFQKTYYSGYKVRAYASELNDAYFVYNISSNPMLEPYQEQRHDELRSIKNYSGVDGGFYDYYTQLPQGPLYDSIRKLGKKLSTGLSAPVDKVIAVRNHFLERDKYGKRIYRYTLKPGNASDPNIPSATMLGNFLFKTHAGYCTYYAGASLFLLRSMGIPSRFTTGFATVNRNDKNKGWYWFYASQAHAWTQVYFPGYGWLDFDMTIGNEDQQNAPRPDGTPPLPPPEPWLVLNSKLEGSPDGKSKKLDVTFDRIIYFDEGYQLQHAVTRSIDASHSRVLYNNRDTVYSVIQPGDSLVVVSFKNEAIKIPAPRPGVTIDVQVSSFPTPLVADEIHIKPRPAKDKKEQPKKDAAKNAGKEMTWLEILILTGRIAAGIIILIILLPLFYLIYLLGRKQFAKQVTQQADSVYYAALYRYHMAGRERHQETPLEYARNVIDPYFHSGFEDFMKIYLRLKYGRGQMLEGDAEAIRTFALSYGSSISNKIGFFRTAAGYFNILLAIRYFLSSENSEDLNQSSLI